MRPLIGIRFAVTLDSILAINEANDIDYRGYQFTSFVFYNYVLDNPQRRAAFITKN